MKEMIRKQKGITLIALVITIVVVIILAGILISLTIGNDNGLFTKAKEASEQYKAAQEHEQVIMESAHDKIDDYTGNAKYKVYEEYEEISYTYTYNDVEKTESFYIIDGWGENSPTVKMLAKNALKVTTSGNVTTYSQEKTKSTTNVRYVEGASDSNLNDPNVNALVDWSTNGFIDVPYPGDEAASTTYKAFYYAKQYGIQVGGEGSLPTAADISNDNDTLKNTIFEPLKNSNNKNYQEYWLGTVVESQANAGSVYEKNAGYCGKADGVFCVTNLPITRSVSKCVRPVITISKDKLPDSTQLL